MSGQNLDELIRQAQSGDRQALTGLLSAVAPVVQRIVWAHAPRQLREDWQQEVLIRLCQRISDYRPTHGLEHWLSRLAINVCCDLHRERSRQKRSAVIAGDVNLVLSRETSPAMRAAQRDLVEQLLDQLPAEDRVVLVMLELEQRSVREIADCLDQGESWVKVRASRARQKLKEWADRRK